MKLISAGHINHGVCFQFKEGDKVCVANNSYISNGYQFHYFKNNRHYCAKYKTVHRANTRMLILREEMSGSARQRNRLKIVVKKKEEDPLVQRVLNSIRYKATPYQRKRLEEILSFREQESFEVADQVIAFLKIERLHNRRSVLKELNKPE